MKRILLPWSMALVVAVLAMLARYLMIQPPEVAHQCDQGAGPAWCAVRSAVIMTYSGYGLGYAALLLAALSLWLRRPAFGAASLAIGAAALVLYCYEPGALAIAVGALVLARSQHQAHLGGARLA